MLSQLSYAFLKSQWSHLRLYTAYTDSKPPVTCVQGEEVPAISRFQAAAVGSSVFIHNHRSLSDMLVLDVADPAAPKLALQPVTGAEGTPMSRCGLLSESSTLRGVFMDKA